MATFWNSADSNPKRNYTYRVTIGGGEAFWVKAATLPSFDVSNTEVHHFDNRYYFPGRVTWNPVSLTMVDPISEDVASAVSKFLANGDYQVPADAAQKTKTINRKSMITAIKSGGTTGAASDIKIEVYDPAATGGTGASIVETWTLVNPFIESAKYGDLAYDNDELKTLEVTIRYDYAQHTEAGLAT